MIIFRNNRVMLMKDFGNMSVGNIYEVANITDTSVILRDAEKKIAVGAIDIDQFDQYFKKPEEVKKWTKWNGLRNASDDTIAFYRTNARGDSRGDGWCERRRKRRAFGTPNPWCEISRN